MENLTPNVIRMVTKELAELEKNPPEGIRVTLNDSDVTDIHAIIDGPEETPYSGGAFEVKLILNRNFPQEPPKGYFVTKIFHPNVSSQGEICVNTLKRDWQPSYGIQHILLTIKCLLIVPNPESALNEEAGKLLLEHYDDYFSRAKMFTDIHARPVSSKLLCTSSGMSGDTVPCKKSAVMDPAKSAILEKKKIEKKRFLKRL